MRRNGLSYCSSRALARPMPPTRERLCLPRQAALRTLYVARQTTAHESGTP